MGKSLRSLVPPAFGLLVFVIHPAALFRPERANAASTTNSADSWTEKSIDELSDPDPAVREHGSLATLNLSGESYESVEAALSRADLSPAARPVLLRALPRLRARARILAEQAKSVAWAGESERSEWDRVGRKNARWNALVETGIEQFGHTTVGGRQAAHQAFEKAIAVGCDDPLVLYLNARSMADLPDTNADELTQRYRAAAKAMLASDYVAARKLLALERYVGISKSIPPDADIDQLLKLVLESAKDPNVPRVVLPEVFYGVFLKLTNTIRREAAFNKLYPTFEQAMPGAWEPLLFKAQFEVKWAWDARGNGWANTVTPQGWKLMSERIEAARSALQQAWKVDPTQSAIAREMITVCMAQSDRDGLETWFRRGIEANPDDYQLCRNKLYALMPRWLGSHEEMLDFGRQCAATENVWASIPNILLDAYTSVAAESPKADEYFKQPMVWGDTHKIFENRIALYPTTYNRSRFAEWAAKCGHWEIVADQCDKLGDKPDRTVFPDQSTYDALRAKVKEQSQEK